VTAVRRLYFYGVSFVSLIMLAVGLSGLGGVLVNLLTPIAVPDGVVASGLRSGVTQNAALVLVGLPVWLLHWAASERAARRDDAERGATLRRLYLYAVLLTMAIRWAFSAHDLLEAVARVILGATDGTGVRDVLAPLPWLLISGALWAYHRNVVVADRGRVGEVGGSATLRRWYTYGLAFVGLLLLLNGSAGVLRLIWEVVAIGDAAIGGDDARAVAGVAATALTGLLLWLAHWSGWAVRAGADARDQDVHSVLRPVYLFLALGFSVGFTLTAGARLLYYGLSRLLGVEEPGGVGGSLLLAMAGPVSTLVVYGVSWLYHRQALAVQARAQPELPRQADVRRLYTYIVAAIALGLLATGAGGLLWTLADALTNAQRTLTRPDWWREQVSLYATLVVVGLPVWLLHWGPVAGPRARGAGRRWTPEEPRALARRLYLYLTLLVGVLSLLGSGAVAARQVLDLLLGDAPTSGAVTNLARALAVAIVAGIAVFYHQRVLRLDAHQGAPAPVTPAGDTRRLFGVVTRPGGADGAADTAPGLDRVAWFSTAEAARAAYRQQRETPDGRGWIALVRVEEQVDQGPPAPAPAPAPSGSAAADAGAAAPPDESGQTT
jgi:hypothetical protein